MNNGKATRPIVTHNNSVSDRGVWRNADNVINDGIRSDPDTQEFNEDHFAQMVPINKLPKAAQAAIAKAKANSLAQPPLSESNDDFDGADKKKLEPRYGSLSSRIKAKKREPLE